MILKQEKHMTEIINSNKKNISWNTCIDEKLGIYEFNFNACIMGADALKIKLFEQCGIVTLNYSSRFKLYPLLKVREHIFSPLLQRIHIIHFLNTMEKRTRINGSGSNKRKRELL